MKLIINLLQITLNGENDKLGNFQKFSLQNEVINGFQWQLMIENEECY